jgi:hypothetical protein
VLLGRALWEQQKVRNVHGLSSRYMGKKLGMNSRDSFVFQAPLVPRVTFCCHLCNSSCGLRKHGLLMLCLPKFTNNFNILKSIDCVWNVTSNILCQFILGPLFWEWPNYGAFICIGERY